MAALNVSVAESLRFVFEIGDLRAILLALLLWLIVSFCHCFGFELAQECPILQAETVGLSIVSLRPVPLDPVLEEDV